MLTAINKQIPHLLALQSPDQAVSFSCSDSFVRDFLCCRMNWSSRKATQATKKIPENWEEICEKTYYCIIYLIIRYRIPVSLLINMDQTGIILIPGADSTYETKGVKQVHLLGKNEKRAFTLAVASSCEGDVLPF